MSVRAPEAVEPAYAGVVTADTAQPESAHGEASVAIRGPQRAVMESRVKDLALINVMFGACFTLPPVCWLRIEEVRQCGRQLDSQAFFASAADVYRVKLAALSRCKIVWRETPRRWVTLSIVT